MGLLPMAPGRGAAARPAVVQHPAPRSQPQQDHAGGAVPAAPPPHRRGRPQRRALHRPRPGHGGPGRRAARGRLRHARAVQPQPHSRQRARPRREQGRGGGAADRRDRPVPAGRDRPRGHHAPEPRLLPRRARPRDRGVRLARREDARPRGGPRAADPGADGDERSRRARRRAFRPRARSPALPRPAARPALLRSGRIDHSAEGAVRAAHLGGGRRHLAGRGLAARGRATPSPDGRNSAARSRWAPRPQPRPCGGSACRASCRRVASASTSTRSSRPSARSCSIPTPISRDSGSHRAHPRRRRLGSVAAPSPLRPSGGPPSCPNWPILPITPIRSTSSSTRPGGRRRAGTSSRGASRPTPTRSACISCPSARPPWTSGTGAVTWPSAPRSSTPVSPRRR